MTKQDYATIAYLINESNSIGEFYDLFVKNNEGSKNFNITEFNEIVSGN